MLSTISRNRTYARIVAIWLTLSVASVILSAVTWWRLSDRLAEAREAVAVQNEVDAILKLLLDVETSQRGFTLTGQEAFLTPLIESQPQLSLHFASLTKLVRHDEDLLRQVMPLRGQAEVLVNHHRRIVKVRQEEGEQAAAAIVASGEGRKTMDAIRALINNIKYRPGTLISDNGDVQRSQLLRASVTSLVAGVFGIGAGIIAFLQSLLALRQQRRERELVEAKLEAERSNREKTVFLANMSHEIRTPMNAILGFCDILKSDLTDEIHQKHLRAITTSGRSLLQLINDILDMSKIEAGVLVLKEEPTDLREICQFIQTMFAEPAGRKDVALTCQIAGDLPAALLLDRVRLRQILVNLVGNAVKFTDQGHIGIRIDRERGADENGRRLTLLIDVQDSGKGIPRDRLDHIFEPFVQAGAHRDEENHGTGLGLSIVKRLTEMMRGSVTVQSALGRGTTFRLRFPHVPVSNRPAQSDRLEKSEPADFRELQPSHVLVVDDNESNRELVAGFLAGSEHRLDFAGNGSQAIDMAGRWHPDVILMDIRMPGMDGTSALGEIRRLPGLETTPVVAVTASSLPHEDPDWKERFDGYLRKPFTKRELFDVLARFLPRREPSAERPGRAGGVLTVPVVDTRPWPDPLRAELQHLLSGPWSDLRDNPAINECRQFAERLAELAGQYDAKSLGQYAHKLARAARQYDVVELEAELAAFPELLEPWQGPRTVQTQSR